MSEAVATGMTREEKKLVAAVERFQKLEEDRQGTQERTSKCAGKRRGREQRRTRPRRHVRPSKRGAVAPRLRPHTRRRMRTRSRGEVGERGQWRR